MDQVRNEVRKRIGVMRELVGRAEQIVLRISTGTTVK